MVAFLALSSFSTAADAGTLPFDNPPVRCAGYGNLNTIVLKNWETGLGTWTAGTHDIANPTTFDTPDWAVVGGLPGGRAGSAAFVANINEGDCGADDETGALTLTSPEIIIPAGAQVPRISIQHWFDIEHGWDGGNLKISVDDGPFNLIPPSAIVYGSYNDTLEPEIMFEDVWNTNPLAGQLAYTSPESGQPAPAWGTTHINLLGIAQPGNSIRLQFDFGIDGCNGNVGWYVDDVEFYHCQAELPPSNCGNGVINGGEQCDDGNNFINDGCSNTCQIESGWECTAPTAPGTIPDHSFEDGTPNDFWDEVSNNPIGTPICRESVCSTGGGTGPSHGTYWAWFGGITGGATDGSLTQSFVIPAHISRLTFDLEAHRCDSEPDYVEVLIDGNQEWVFDGSHPLCGEDGYTRQTVDIEAYADGGVHEVAFHGETFAIPGGRSDIFIDNAALPGDPSFCSRIGTSLTLIKNVVNDSGGDGHPTHWTLSASGPSPFSGIGPTVNNAPGFSAGTYNLSESGPPGYAASNWDCDGGNQTDGDTVIVGSDQSVRCTITNDDQFPTIRVIKNIVNNSGGTVTDPNAFGLMVDGQSVEHDVAKPFVSGSHEVSETGLPGYSASAWGGDCNPDGTTHLVFGQAAVCTITNDDISPTLTLQKTIINDNGGTVTTPDSFGLRIDGNSVSHNVANPVPAGPHTASEVGLAGYQASTWGGDCAPDGTIDLALGQNATCTITNDDIPPTLTVVKTIINDNGGTVTDPDAFGLMVDGNPVMHNVAATLNAGSHTASETGLSGYVASPWGGDCNSDGTISLSPGDNATCTITNNDSDATSLTLVKEVVNDNGGTAAPSAWTLTASGPTGFSGPGPSVSFGPGFSAGTYDLSESGPAGYAASAWVCLGGTQNDADTVTVGLGQSVTCTITNNDISPLLRVVKTIINNNGGSVTNPDAFGLMVDGNSVQHNVFNPFDAGPHTVSETGLSGYDPSPWGGDCNPDGTITLALAQNATCTITNDDSDQNSLTLVKEVVNDNGGGASPENWTLAAIGPSSFSGPGPTVVGGPGIPAGTYHLSESGGPAGYTASAWNCIGGTQEDDDTVVLDPGDTPTCTITNDDIPASLTLQKTIVNDDGGTEMDPDAFGLRVDGNLVQHDVPNSIDAGFHTVSEDGLPGYAQGSWGGDCNPDGTITLEPAQDAICTITNDDIADTSLTLNKVVSNDNGGTAAPSQWTLTATGPTNFSGSGPSVSSPDGFAAGTYDLSESAGPAGYTANAWVCMGGMQTDDDTIVLELGDAASCTITNDDISPTLTVLKNIVNDSGGTVMDPDAFGLMIDDSPVLHGVINMVDAGAHVVSEAGLSGYAQGPWSGDCAADGTITLALDQDATCTVTNDDVAPTITVVKTVVNDDGGTVNDPNAFGLMVDGNPVSHDVTNEFDVGPHTVSEAGLAGYQAGTWGGDCEADGTIDLALGQQAVCTITNNDIPPTLTVLKTVINDNGGTVDDPDAFSLMVDGTPVLHGVANALDAGPHTVSETPLPGYDPSPWGGDCATDGTITLALAQNATCTITNDDSNDTSLTLVKSLTNDNGGDAVESDWTLTATGPTGFSGAGPTVSSAPSFDAGTYDLSESGPTGYEASAWDCVGGTQNDDDTVTVGLGQSVTCTITNDDIPPTLTVFKEIINDNGGTENDPDAFGLMVDGNPVTHNVANEFDTGPHTVSEVGLSGYDPGPWGGDCAADGTITLSLAENATCTITNDDSEDTSLTLVKSLTNDNGGDAVESDWTLTATGPTGFSGPGPTVSSAPSFDAGTYDLSESGPAGYEASAWVCTGGTQNDNDTVTVGLGESVTCTITNDDIPPTLTVFKEIINDNGGTVNDPDAFNLMVDGNPVLHNVANEFDAGLHTVTETPLPGYDPSPWSGDCASDGTITLALAQNATCTITNDDSEDTSLTLVKSLTNDNGGDAVESDWTLTATGPTGFSGPGPMVSSAPSFDAGTYDLSESGPTGYEASAWVCTGGTQNDDDTVTVGLGESVTCTITNDDISPTLTVVKNIVNDNGGTVTDPDAFNLMVDGTPVLHDVANAFDAGMHTVSEVPLPGYDPGLWGGDCATDGTITLSLAQNATCTITNDDSEDTSLTLVKALTNDNGGDAAESDWTLTATGPTGFSGPGPTVSSAPSFDAGTYDLSESGPAGYEASAWVCTGGTQNDDDTVTVGLGESVACTITNDDISPTLTVVKNIVNDNGGTENDPDAFGLMVDGNTVLHDVANEFDAGPHTVSEAGLPGYIPGDWGGDCNADGTITLALAQDATCTITNDDTDATSLTLVKVVSNNNGGSATAMQWTLSASGPTPFSGLGPNVSSGDGFQPGTYDLSEAGPAGYEASAWVCDGGTQDDDDTITLALGESANCTITNDDISPTLTVVKEIINDSGGTETDPDAFGLRVDGNPVLHNVTNEFDAGLHTVSEDGLEGYEAGDWGGDCNADGTITLDLAQVATCTITNDDINQTSLTLVKEVINDNGGEAAESEWTLTATGPNGFSGPGPSVSSGADFQGGTYDLSESGPAGYAASAWVCTGGTQNDGDTITLELGEVANCTITNDDISPTLTVVKEIVNDSGGTETNPDAFGLRVDGNPVQHNATNEFDAGLHTVSEDGLEGYEAGDWGGDCNADGSITLVLAEDAACTITNDDINPLEIFFIDGFETTSETPSRPSD